MKSFKEFLNEDNFDLRQDRQVEIQRKQEERRREKEEKDKLVSIQTNDDPLIKTANKERSAAIVAKIITDPNTTRQQIINRAKLKTLNLKDWILNPLYPSSTSTDNYSTFADRIKQLQLQKEKEEKEGINIPVNRSVLSTGPSKDLPPQNTAHAGEDYLKSQRDFRRGKSEWAMRGTAQGDQPMPSARAALETIFTSHQVGGDPIYGNIPSKEKAALSMGRLATTGYSQEGAIERVNTYSPLISTEFVRSWLPKALQEKDPEALKKELAVAQAAAEYDPRAAQVRYD